MAASSSSSGGLCKYAVFLSFRGEDTRQNFVCHLHRDLEQKTIKTFIDSEDLDKGSRISELLNAIENSRLSIVVLSQNYASSSWCLKELVKILECKDTKNQIVVPIFYRVDPSHIRKLDGKFGEAFTNKFGGADKQELESWRSALARVADLSGWDSTNYPDDIKLIEGIVEDTWKKWIRIARPSNPAHGLVGMGSHIMEVNLRLCGGVNDVGVVGIWGMPGIGKTTIARAVYDEIAGEFEHKCFLDNVKEAFINKREVKMQEDLLSGLLKKKVESANRNMIMEGLRKKKVLVVLDDVDTVAQIRDLLGNPHSFDVGSRIIITTRNKQSLSEDDELYEPERLSDVEALELFMKYALGDSQPTGDYNHLSRRAIEYAKGLPLALKVLGASLYNRNESQWKVVLDKLEEIPHRGIMDVLKTSIEGLDHSEKNIFLDIACFFRGEDKCIVTKILDDCGYFPDMGLTVLVDRALITGSFEDYDHDDEIDMHDLLQDMGREMVCQDPRGCSRLWSYEDGDCVLTPSTATEAVECIVLDLSNSKFDLCIDTEAFGRMTKLRLLMICYSLSSLHHDEYDDDGILNFEFICPSDGCKQHGRGNFESLSHELRILLWHGCPLNSLPSNFKPINLVRLDMRGSRIQQLWEGIKHMKKLKVILLSYCKYLVKIPDLREAIHLERLILDGCSSLIEVHPSILTLQNLLIFSLEGCEKLKFFPSSIAMKSLRSLDLSGCSNLEEYPEISEETEKLTWLYLAGTAIRELPSSINYLTGLLGLMLGGCRELKILPSPIAMKSLFILDLSGCQNLEEFPEISEVMENLRSLCVDETAIKELPSSIERLQGLKSVRMRNCTSLVCLPDNICNLARLTSLDLSGCSKLSSLPENIGSLNSLTELEVQDSGIKQLPFSLSLLKKLRISLSRNGLNEMKIPISAWWSSIHPDHVRHLDLSDCNLLELSESIAQLSSLESLKLCRNKFESLPATMNRLRRLIDLRLEACDRLKSIPELSSSINYIDAHDCTSLETVSKPKPQYHTKHFFTFSNCSRLVQTNLFRDIVERHSHFQDHLRPLRLNISLPGHEVPDWFDHQSRGFSVSVQLPPNWFDSRFLGFAICAVRTRWGTNLHTSPLCTFKGNFGESSFRFHLLDSFFIVDRSLWSDHMFLGYVSRFECPLIKEGRLVNEDYTEAIFQIVSEFVTEPLLITSCGVRLIYANPDDLLNLSMARPQFHVDRCETGVSFMDPCDMRNKEQRGQKSLKFRRRDTCHRLQLSPELSDLGSHSGLPVPEPQVREKKRESMRVSVMEEELAVERGPLCSCFYWLGALWR